MHCARVVLLFAFAAACWLSNTAPAQDADGDGIPDPVERKLGTDPRFAERLELVFTDRSRAEGDRNVSKSNYWPERDIVAVYFAPVARGRFLWRIDFAQEYSRDNSVLILYLNADNDSNTGRKDAPDGWDYMLTLEGPRSTTRYIDPEGRYSSYRPPLIEVVGKSVYMCADLPVNQEGGKSVYTASVLSETRQPHKYVDSTGVFAVAAAGESNREKMLTPLDLKESQGVRVCDGLALLRRVVEDRKNVVIPIESCKLDGFMHDTRVEYREDSVRRVASHGSITAVVPRAGEWYPAVIFYDGRGDERFLFKVNGEQKGVIVANIDDNRQRLFALEQKLKLARGDTITLELVTPTGVYRTEDFVLLAELPPAWKRTFEISDVSVFVPWDSGGREASVAWITNWPTRGTVKYGATAALGEEITEGLELNNHRVRLAGLAPGKTYRFRIVCPTPDGGERSTEGRFVAQPPEIPKGSARRKQIPLSIVCQGALGAGSWPITQGVPLPQGELGSAENVRLLDDAGNEVPCQVAVTGRWPDGSVKWLLLDFDVTLAKPAPLPRDPTRPEPVARYILEYGTEVTRSPHPAPVAVAEQGDSVVVDTGAMKVELSRGRFGPFERVWREGKLVFQASEAGGLRLVDAQGKEHTSLSPVDELKVEDAGPQRACVKIAGRLRAEDGGQLFAYEARAHFYAGKPFLRLFVTFANDNVEERWTNIRSLSLVLPLGDAANAQALACAIERAQRPPLRLAQLSHELYELALGANKSRKKGRVDGWVALRGESALFGAALRNFWQLYPKALAATARGIEIALCPPLDAQLYRVQGTDAHRIYYYLSEGTYKLRSGFSKRHELLLAFAPPEFGFSAAAGYLQNPPLAVCPPRWYCQTKVFGDLADPEQTAAPDYDAVVSRAMDNYLANRERNHEYGMMNFGDWWGERGINWGNIEYDTQHAFLLHWARTGDLRFFFCAEQAARHNMDVDTIRYARSAELVGCVYAHCVGHVGDYFPTSPVPGKGLNSGSITVSHTWTEGLCDYYFLTGDRRALETAKLVADHYDTYGTRNYDFTNCRIPGWHLILTMGLYRATNDPFYLNAAKIIVERVLERQTPDGGWRRQLVGGHCQCTPKHHGNAGFMVAILLTGLKVYHQATGDPRIPEAMRRAARFLIDDMWVEEVEGFRYTSCPKTGAGTWSNFMIFDGALYAARLTGDKVIPQYAVRGMRRAFKNGISGFGKSISQQTRVLPHIVYELQLLQERAGKGET